MGVDVGNQLLRPLHHSLIGGVDVQIAQHDAGLSLYIVVVLLLGVRLSHVGHHIQVFLVVSTQIGAVQLSLDKDRGVLGGVLTAAQAQHRSRCQSSRQDTLPVFHVTEHSFFSIFAAGDFSHNNSILSLFTPESQPCSFNFLMVY